MRPAPAFIECCRIASLLLDYPWPALHALGPGLAAAVASLPKSRSRAALEQFLRYWCETPIEQIAGHYVETFDFQQQGSLHLTHHLSGDTRARGPMLVRLRETYREAGWRMPDNELPDYLPVMLEFTTLSPATGMARLAELRPALEIVSQHLRDLRSPYEYVLQAVLAGLPRLPRTQRKMVAQLAASEPPIERVGLDDHRLTITGQASK